MRIELRQGNKKTFTSSYGTGTIIKRRGIAAYVVTCAHMTRGYRSGDRLIVRAGGRLWGAVIECSDPLWEVAVLRIGDPGVKPMAIAGTAPKAGEAVSFAGFGSGSYRHVAGQFLGYCSPSKGQPSELYEVSGTARGGDSGGPMLNARGELVGVLWGTNKYEQQTVGCGLPRLRRILRFLLPPYPNRPGVIVPKPIAAARSLPPPSQLAPPFKPPQDEKPVFELPGPIDLTPPPITIDPPAGPPEINYEKLAALVFAKMQADPDKFRGPAGAVGLQGPRGQGGPQGEQGPQGKTGGAGPTPATNIDDLAVRVIEKLNKKPLFYVVHKDPETGEVISYSNPETGEVLVTQAVQWGDTYILYLHKRSNSQQVQP